MSLVKPREGVVSEITPITQKEYYRELKDAYEKFHSGSTNDLRMLINSSFGWLSTEQGDTFWSWLSFHHEGSYPSCYKLSFDELLYEINKNLTLDDVVFKIEWE
jgi:hypothetical protein